MRVLVWLSLLCMLGVHAELKVLVNAAQAGSDWTYAWSLEGKWEKGGPRVMRQLVVSSSYSNAGAVDRLVATQRWIGMNAQGWKPVLLLQYTGRHNATGDPIVLAALGMRRQWSFGFVELTGGVSHKGADGWLGDAGLSFAVEKKLSSRWTIHSGPQAQYGTSATMNMRDHDLRFSWDIGMDYMFAHQFGLGYRLWMGSDAPKRTQWIGITWQER